jgi:hypothetical protein
MWSLWTPVYECLGVSIRHQKIFDSNIAPRATSLRPERRWSRSRTMHQWIAMPLVIAVMLACCGTPCVLQTRLMEQRAQGYQLLLWSVLRADAYHPGQVVPDPEHLRVVYLRHTDAADAIARRPPGGCSERAGRTISAQDVQQKLSRIPTRFRVEEQCDGPLLKAGAAEVVGANKFRIRGFFVDKE